MPPRQSFTQPTSQPKETDKPAETHKDAGRRAGTSHFPLQVEQGRKRRVPPLGTSKDGTAFPTGQGTHGHRRSRTQGRQAILDSEGRFDGKGGKGGKTGGSRAGLLASRKKPPAGWRSRTPTSPTCPNGCSTTWRCGLAIASSNSAAGLAASADLKKPL